MSNIKDELEELKIYEKQAVKKVYEEVEKVCNQMTDLYAFLKAWEDKIGKENIEKIHIKEK